MGIQEKVKFLSACDTSFVADALVRLGWGGRMRELTVDTALCAPLNRETTLRGSRFRFSLEWRSRASRPGICLT